MSQVLVIEDEEDVREIILDILEEEGFDVIGAPNGAVGLEMVLERNPDLILCDVMMPELDGHGVLKKLKEDPKTATIPFIFLTAKSTMADLRDGMTLGADDYLTKPFTRDDLLGSIATRLEKRQFLERQSEERLAELRDSITLSLPHELRTPLNGIIASAQLAIDIFDDLSPEELQEMLGDIQTSARRLYDLISNFLLLSDLSLIERDPERLQAIRQSRVENPASIIEEEARDRARRNAAGDREADLKLSLEDDPIRLSETSLRKIVAELVSNASKFSQPGQPIEVTSALESNHYCLTVSDRGRGITQDQIAKIGAYQQFDRDRHEQQGSGLGLSIVKQLIDLHKGRLMIDSDREGTQVRVELQALELSP